MKSKNRKHAAEVKEKRSFWPYIFFIFLAAFAVYANSLKGQFIWDDDFLIRENASIKQWAYAPRLFTGDISVGSLEKTTNYYRPLQTLSFMPDYFFWKLNVVGYHLSSVVWHAAAACALFYFLYVLFGNAQLAFFAGLLFAVHPVHTEAVAYISGRADPMALFFILLAFTGYLKGSRAPAARHYLSALLCFGAALLCREGSLIFPVLLLIYHFSFRDKIRLPLFGAVFVVAILYIVLRLTILKGFMFSTPSSLPLGDRLLGFLAAISHYMRLLIWPFDLHMEYGLRVFPFMDAGVIIGLLMTIGLFVYAWRQRQAQPLVTFSVLWFFACLLPVSDIIPASAYFAEHWLYMPSIGFFLMAGQGLTMLTKKSRPLGAMGLLVPFVFFSILTIRQNSYWGDPEVFYERTLRYAPHSPRVLINLGSLYKSKGRLDDAVACFKRALDAGADKTQIYANADIRFVKAYLNLGNIYAELKEYREATRFYEKAVELDPNCAEAYNNLGNIAKDTGRADEAIAFYKKAVAIKPAYADAYNNWAITSEALGRYDEAISGYRRAIELNPDQYFVYNNLGQVYHRAGRFDEAIDAYKGALAVKPDYADAYSNLAVTYNAKGMPQEAIAAFKKAIEADPHCAVAYQNLAVLYYQRGQKDTAREVIDKAVRLGCSIDPQLIKALKADKNFVTQ